MTWERNADGIGTRIIVGAAGGLLGALAMNVLARAASLAQDGADDQHDEGRGPQPDEAQESQEDDATVKAGRAVYRAAAGHEPDQDTAQQLGSAAHFGFGAAVGVAYMLLSPHVPALRKNFGTTYGSVVWAVADEGVVPALGLSSSPTEIPLSTHAYALCAHWVYGATLEGVRRLAARA